MEWYVQTCTINDSITTRTMFVWNQGFFPLLNGSASYSAISSYNMLREDYGGLKSTLRIKREIQNSFLSR